MARRVAGFSLIELTMTVALVGILAIPMGGLLVEHLGTSSRADTTIAATNLARYEQEMFLFRSATGSWCSVPRASLPASDPDRASCPATVSAPNPYAGMPFVVYRINTAQTATDNAGSLRRIRVVVKRIMAQSGASITALEQMVTAITFSATGVSFGS
jgi:prepilin-type N-terminal cleavage/methylation domain-containing protein